MHEKMMAGCLRVLAGCAILMNLSLARGQTPSPPVPGAWQLQFEDNFDGSTLDGSKWRLGSHTAGLNGQSGIAPENVTVSDGKLKIKAEQRSISYSGKTESYASGEVSTFTHFRQQYGYYEARVKYPAVTGLWPAFWLMPDRALYGYRDIYARSYVKFDLTGVDPGAVTSAELKMKVSAVEALAAGQNNNVFFMKVHNDSWSESALNWDNKPVPDPVWIAQRWNQAVAGQDMVIDVKDYIAEEMAGDKVVSFAAADSFMLTKYIKFYSSEAAQCRGPSAPGDQRHDLLRQRGRHGPLGHPGQQQLRQCGRIDRGGCLGRHRLHL